MCLVLGLEEYIKKIGEIIKNFTTPYFNNSEINIIDYKDKLKDHLADLKDNKTINHCGCEGLFEVKLFDSNTILVYMDVHYPYKFIITKDSMIWMIWSSMKILN